MLDLPSNRMMNARNTSCTRPKKPGSVDHGMSGALNVNAESCANSTKTEA
jgi:hypothetical protein